MGLVPAVFIAMPLFNISIFELGFPLYLLLLSLYMFGITLGLLVTAGLIRFGPSFENIAWASLFFLAPLGCIYYPIEILPEWLQVIAKLLPLVHIFEEMRNILIYDTLDYFQILKAIIISFISFSFFAICIFSTKPLNKEGKEIGIDGSIDIIEETYNKDTNKQLDDITRSVMDTTKNQKLTDDLTVISIGK